ncbi:hypothetical protein TWF718_009674 [Orbilia javanica]|uniref:Uncharacterized protein n=1 Tax=Orbilia javanica TaxID=47235 RepID=A0AAN8MZL3_9PEZI
MISRSKMVVGGRKREGQTLIERISKQRPRIYAKGPQNCHHKLSTLPIPSSSGSMAQKPEEYQPFWIEELSPDALAAFYENYTGHPKKEGNGSIGADEVKKALYGTTTPGERWRRLRDAIGLIVDSFIKFNDPTEAAEPTREYLKSIKSWKLPVEQRLRVSKAICQIPEYANHVSESAADPMYLTSWLWDNRILYLIEVSRKPNAKHGGLQSGSERERPKAKKGQSSRGSRGGVWEEPQEGPSLPPISSLLKKPSSWGSTND